MTVDECMHVDVLEHAINKEQIVSFKAQLVQYLIIRFCFSNCPY